MQPHKPDSKIGLALRVGVFIFLAYAGYLLFPVLILPLGGYFIAAVFGAFTAAAVANALALRIYERGQLADIGLQWNAASAMNLGLGVAGGIGSACVILVPSLLFGLARWQPDPEFPGGWPQSLYVSLILIFGAVGEEMLFRGYAFQVLLKGIGPFATILPMSVLFGLAHSSNMNAGWLSIANTIGWGFILGVAFLRSGDLWLPIGLHYGWNWALPIFGVNISGFKMGVTGYTLDWSVGDLWSGGAYGPEGGLFTSIVLAVLAVYLWRAPIQGQEAFLLRPREEA